MKILIISILIITFPVLMFAQIPYGNNPEVGKYIQTDDAKIYYEVYGEGEPLLLIHGSLWGYISEYKKIFPELTKRYKVIAVALRGHGKSEIGNRDYSYELFADDIIQVLKNENIDKTSILGFSSGAITALKIADKYPSFVNKVVSMAGALGAIDKNPENIKELSEMTGQKFVLQAPSFVENRKTLMPEPERYIDFYNKLKVAHLDSIWISDEAASQIQAPVLIVGGDRDNIFPAKAFARVHALIPNSRLLIIPNSGHVDVLLNRDVYLNYAIPFLEN